MNKAGQLVLSFSLNDDYYAINFDHVSEVIEKKLIVPFPMSKDPAKKGIISIRGKVLPVFVPLFYPKDKPDGGDKILVLNHKQEKYAIMVDKVKKVRLEAPCRAGDTVNIQAKPTLIVNHESILGKNL